jgi:hypothetical protein
MEIKKHLLTYTLEFFVILLGISLSFYLERKNDSDYKEELKNQSLNRISNNLTMDLRDMEFNAKAHTKASEAIAWLVKNNHNLLNLPKDTVGLKISQAVSIATIFVDNQEEYRALQNSGLIELIELEEVVLAIQNKYKSHDFYKKIEDMIVNQGSELRPYMYQNTQLKHEQLDELGFHEGRVFTGTEPIPNTILERLKDKKWIHDFYQNRMQDRIKKDSALQELIHQELQKDPHLN